MEQQSSSSSCSSSHVYAAYEELLKKAESEKVYKQQVNELWEMIRLYQEHNNIQPERKV